MIPFAEGGCSLAICVVVVNRVARIAAAWCTGRVYTSREMCRSPRIEMVGVVAEVLRSEGVQAQGIFEMLARPDGRAYRGLATPWV